MCECVGGGVHGDYRRAGCWLKRSGWLIERDEDAHRDVDEEEEEVYLRAGVG